MVWFDYLLIITVLLSVLVSVTRGFIREALSLSALVMSLLGALKFGPYLVPTVQKWITQDNIVVVVAIAITFLILWLCFAVINVIIIRMLRVTGFGSADKSLGALFGLVRGGMVVIVVVLISGWFNSVVTSSWWQKSTLVPHVQVASRQLERMFPQLKTLQKQTSELSTVGGRLVPLFKGLKEADRNQKSALGGDP